MRLNLEASEGILFVSVGGFITLSRAVDIFQQACDAAIAHGLNCILVDCLNAHSDLTDLERYHLGKSMSDYYIARSPAMKVAVVGNPPLVNGFGALVACNRGLLAQTFPDRQAATNWLNRFRQNTKASKA